MKTMKTVKQFLSKVAIRQVWVICLVGMLMLTSVACGNTRSAASPPSANPSTTGQGMYPHGDTTRDTTAADAKARRAVQQADRQRQKVQRSDNYFEEVQPGQKLQGKAEDVGISAQQAAKNAAQKTQRGLQNLKENTQDAVEQATDAIDQAT